MVTVTNKDEEPRRRGRGRPRKWTRDEYGSVGEYWAGGAADDPELESRPMFYSRRQQENIVLAFHARDRIAAENPDGYVPEIPRTVMTELGRIEDEALFREALDWYLERGGYFSAHHAARIVRHKRRGTTG